MSTPYGPKDPSPEPERPVVVVPPEEPAASSTPPPADQAYYRPSLPGQNSMIMRPTSVTHAVIRGALAAFLAIAGGVNLFWGGRFPSNAPVEQIYNAGISLDLFAATVVLGIFAILSAARRSVPVKPHSISPMAIAAVILSGVVFIFWLVSGVVPVLVSVGSGESYQYMSGVGAIVFLGIPWVLGMVFGALSLRSGGRLTPVLGTIAIVLGVLVTIGAVAFAVIYGLGLSN